MSQLSIILWELSFLPDVSELCIPEEYFDRTNEGAGTDLYQFNKVAGSYATKIGLATITANEFC